MNRIIATILIAAFLAFPATASANEAQQIRKYKAQVKELKAEKAKYRKLYVKYRIKTLRKQKWWRDSDIRFVATQEAKRAGFKGEMYRWAVEACVRTAKREAGKKWGDKKRTYYLYSTHSVKKSGRMGLHQWGREWAGSKAKKTDGVWSCRRFMKVLKVGGKRKVRQHWKQTIGSM